MNHPPGDSFSKHTIGILGRFPHCFVTCLDPFPYHTMESHPIPSLWSHHLAQDLANSINENQRKARRGSWQSRNFTYYFLNWQCRWLIQISLLLPYKWLFSHEGEGYFLNERIFFLLNCDFKFYFCTNRNESQIMTAVTIPQSPWKFF